MVTHLLKLRGEHVSVGAPCSILGWVIIPLGSDSVFCRSVGICGDW